MSMHNSIYSCARIRQYLPNENMGMSQTHHPSPPPKHFFSHHPAITSSHLFKMQPRESHPTNVCSAPRNTPTWTHAWFTPTPKISTGCWYRFDISTGTHAEGPLLRYSVCAALRRLRRCRPRCNPRSYFPRNYFPRNYFPFP